MDYRIDRSQGLVITTAEGIVTLPEVRSYIQRLHADPDFESRFNQLIDAKRVTQMLIPANEIIAIISNTAFGAASRRAWVVNNDEMSRMLAGVFAAQMSLRHQSQVFHDYESAFQWLGTMDPMSR